MNESTAFYFISIGEIHLIRAHPHVYTHTYKYTLGRVNILCLTNIIALRETGWQDNIKVNISYIERSDAAKRLSKEEM